MTKAEIVPQRIVEKRTLILKPRLDYPSVRSRGEALKAIFSHRHALFKDKSEDMRFVASSKYYEPYLVLGGKYSIDYCKRQVYAFQVSNQTQKIQVGCEVFKVEPSPSQLFKTLEVAGEEHLHYEKETYIILDKSMREVSPEQFLLAPFENEQENSPESELDLRRLKISLESEIELLRSRIANRPQDVAGIIREDFEITHRLVVYRPIYELAFQNIKNGETPNALIDGITGEMITDKPSRGISQGNIKQFDRISSIPSPIAETGSQLKEKWPHRARIPEILSKVLPIQRQKRLTKNTRDPRIQFTLGCLSLVAGIFADSFALFGWGNLNDSLHFLGEYVRYACIYSGFGAIIFGAILIYDFLVLKSQKSKSQPTATAIKKAGSDKEDVYFVVPELEEDTKAEA